MSFINKTKEFVKEKIYGPKIYFIIGPTSSGKTSFSIDFVKKLEAEAAAAGRRLVCEIISADSRQVYKDFDISSGKISHDEMQNIPHHLLDVVEPGEKYTVQDYSLQANKIIQDIFKKNNTPVVVGGTGFYIDNILYDYKLPSVPRNDNLETEISKLTQDEVFKKIETLDPEYAAREYENRNNNHRMRRALFIIISLGKMPPLDKKLRYKNFEFIFLNPKKEILYEKVYKRICERLELGLLDEIRNVKSKYNLSYEYLDSLGLEFFFASQYLQNKINKQEFIEQLFAAHKKYIKRQLAWFKRYSQLS